MLDPTLKYLYKRCHVVKIWASPTLRWVGRQHAASNPNLQCRYQACLCKVWAAFEALMCCFVDGCVSHSQSKPCREDSSAFVAMTPLLQHRLRLHKIGLALAYVNQRNISTTGLLEEYCIKTPPWKHSQRCNSDLGSCSHDFRDGQELPFSCQEIAHHTSYYVITLCIYAVGNVLLYLWLSEILDGFPYSPILGLREGQSKSPVNSRRSNFLLQRDKRLFPKSSCGKAINRSKNSKKQRELVSIMFIS